MLRSATAALGNSPLKFHCDDAQGKSRLPTPQRFSAGKNVAKLGNELPISEITFTHGSFLSGHQLEYWPVARLGFLISSGSGKAIVMERLDATYNCTVQGMMSTVALQAISTKPAGVR
ncbi:hypothetical protein [Aestuariivirga litoralis]|uniref:hypothetical protein n=1 Tax=Aestuariivirga litoralis TaxID=2650924 RepID=UPI0018C5AC99|nr:hypothetical protein [Aestuariivirga litoralis]MBG1233491.1 hypothetical protein [Aestuariivirga litoralis]